VLKRSTIISAVTSGFQIVPVKVFAGFLNASVESKKVFLPVTFWVSLSPRKAPAGLALVEILAVPPAVVRTPADRVATPVPPPATGKVP